VLSVPTPGGLLRAVANAPSVLDAQTAADAWRLAGQTLHVADKLLLGHNPESPLIGSPGIAKRTVWSQTVPVAEIRRVGHPSGATVNDVLVAAVSGALASYVRRHGGEPADLTTMVPVDVREPGVPLPRELGNKFALVLLPLPTGTASPLARLAESKRRMDVIKTSPEAAITFGLAGAIGRTHRRLSRPLVDFFAGKAIGVTTDVPGPRELRYVAGTRVAGALGWVPGSGRQTVGVCIFSYARQVRVGFKVDAATVPDPERLVEAFDAELDDYLRLPHAV
jgi:WS/DGAT/MGAT family acyltransferase